MTRNTHPTVIPFIHKGMTRRQAAMAWAAGHAFVVAPHLPGPLEIINKNSAARVGCTAVTILYGLPACPEALVMTVEGQGA